MSSGVRLTVVGSAIALAVALLLLPHAVNRNRLGLSLAAVATGGWCDEQSINRSEGLLQRGYGQSVVPGKLGNFSILKRLESLRIRCQSASFLAERVSNEAVRVAERCFSNGDYACTISEAKVALRSDPKQLHAYWLLHSAFQALGEQGAAVAVEISSLSPEYPLASPVQVGDYQLVGYDLIESALEFENQVVATLYWQAPYVHGSEFKRMISDHNTLYSLPGRVYQVITSPNLVHNGGFELTLGSESDNVSGFSKDRYGSDLSAHRQRTSERDGIPTQCGELDNTRSILGASGFTSDVNVVPQLGEQYLVGAWVHEPVEGVQVGVRRLWPSEDQRNSYVMPIIRTAEWEYRTGVVDVPTGTHQIVVQLLNQDPRHVACFDDVILLRLDGPEPKTS
jgi:hypothetical protein